MPAFLTTMGLVVFKALTVAAFQHRRIRLSWGQAMVEYAVILALAVVIVIVVLTVVGNQVHNVFANISCAISNAGSCPTPTPSHD